MKYCLFAFLLFNCISSALFGIVPTINSLSPYYGPSTGGTEVIISGSGFTGITDVFFGNVPATAFVVDSDASVRAISPEHSPQVIPLTVVNPSGTSLITDQSFYVFQGDWQAYVSNNDDNSISIIDTATQLVTHTTAVGTQPRAIAITPDGSQIYTANSGSGTVSAINAATNLVSASVTVGNQPSCISVLPNGDKAYVAKVFNSTISVIDTTTNSILSGIALQTSAVSTTITPDGTQLLAGTITSNRVSFVNTASDTLTNTRVFGNIPMIIDITPDGSKACIVDNGNNTLFVFNLTTNATTSIPLISQPFGIAISPDGGRAYVNLLARTVAVIDLNTLQVLANITTGNPGNRPSAVLIAPDGTTGYIANLTNNNVSVFSTATNGITGTIPVGVGPNCIAITPDGKYLFTTNFGSNNVSIIDLTNNTVSTIPVGTRPNFVAITPDQAPLARFTVTIAPVGQTSTFDASPSLSPTGTITMYEWDFGDGNTLNTSASTTTHVYNQPGTYNITLTVTNSAGTSTSQIANHYSFLTNFTGVLSSPFTNNGGPTAQTSQSINVIVGVLPPQDFNGIQKANKFLNGTEYINVLTWKASLSSNVISYKIYRDAQLTDLVAEIPSTQPLIYFDRNRTKNKPYTYYIVAVSATGVSDAVSTTVL